MDPRIHRPLVSYETMEHGMARPFRGPKKREPNLEVAGTFKDILAGGLEHFYFSIYQE